MRYIGSMSGGWMFMGIFAEQLLQYFLKANPKGTEKILNKYGLCYKGGKAPVKIEKE